MCAVLCVCVFLCAFRVQGILGARGFGFARGFNLACAHVRVLAGCDLLAFHVVGGALLAGVWALVFCFRAALLT